LALVYIGIILLGLSIPVFSQSTQIGNTTGFPAGSLVLLANGKEKSIEQILPGDILAAYDPVNEEFIPNLVNEVHAGLNQDSSIVTLMLVQEELTASLQVNGGTLGIILPVIGQQPVLTATGVKQISQLLEADKLFCYNEAVGRFELFTVYGMDIQNKFIDKVYRLITEHKNYIVNGAVVVNEQ
jgi:hypothetical protein